MTLKGRAAGGFYLLTIIAGMFAAYTSSNSYGDAANLISNACYVAVTLLLYRLLKPVNQPISMLAAVFGLITCLLGGLDAIHYHPVHIHYLVFSGFYCLLLGYLIFKSTFLPRFLGVLVALSGVGWLTYLSPHLAHLHGTTLRQIILKATLT
jgi:intracellular septation protein A